eukprot:2186239-Prymnesium_polylepis.1
MNPQDRSGRLVRAQTWPRAHGLTDLSAARRRHTPAAALAKGEMEVEYEAPAPECYAAAADGYAEDEEVTTEVLDGHAVGHGGEEGAEEEVALLDEEPQEEEVDETDGRPSIDEASSAVAALAAGAAAASAAETAAAEQPQTKRRRRGQGMQVPRWTAEEEQRLADLVKECGERDWARVAERLNSGAERPPRSAAGVDQHWQIMNGKRKRNG